VKSWLDRQIEGIIRHIDKQLQCLPQDERVVRESAQLRLSETYLLQKPDKPL
jgi:hypothetical protein